MGLFFDQDWFDDRLKASGLTRGSLALAAGMGIDEIEQVFRDQRELESHEVLAFAQALSVDPYEVASRSGAADPVMSAAPAIKTMRGEPMPAPGGFVVTREVIAGLHERMDRLEKLLEMVLMRLDRGR